MPDDSKVLVPYNVLNTSSDQVTPLLYAGSGLTSIETNRAAAERAAHEFPQTPRLPISKPEPSVSIEGLNVPQVLDKRVSTSADPLELVWQAWQDKYEQAKTFIEQGYNEQNIDIQRDLITELEQAKESITNIPAELSSPVDAVIADANNKSKGWIDELAKSDRANAYQLARHIDGSLKAVTEALKAFEHDQNLQLETWKEKVCAGYKQKHGLTQDTENLRHHMTLRRHAVRNRLQDVRHELESSKNKIQRKGWRNTFKREDEVKHYFTKVMNALEVVINDLKNKQTQFDPSFKDSAASMFVSKAGQSKEEKRQRGEHKQDKESKSINLADVEVAMGEQILKFEDAAVKAGKATKSTVAKMGEGAKNKMAKVAMQVARTPTYVAPTAMHLLHKARSPMAKSVNKALNRNLSDEDQIIRSIVRSLCWVLIQPAFRMQYDYAPLLGAAQTLAKSKPSTTDSADLLETVTEGSAATSGINKAASAQSEEVSGEAEKSRQEVLEPSLKKAEQASESLLAQVSLGGNGALKDVLKHYPLSDLTQLLEQLQSLSISEETPDTKIRPSLNRDVHTLKNLLAQEPSSRGAQLNQVSASERERLVNILSTIKDMGLSEQRFNKTVEYFLGLGQEVLTQKGQESLGKIVVKIEDALRKGEAYKKVRAMALRLRSRATKASDYQDSSLDSIIHKARFAGLAARDAYDELDSLALKHTGQPLGPFSRRSRVAKDWGMCANEVLREAGHTDAALIPDTEVIRHTLTERGMLTGLASDNDPLGIFFSTRVEGEWRYAYRGETIKPMSPADYAAQEKTLAEFIVSWSQKRLARGVIVSFIEGGVDVVGGLTVTPIKIGIRAGIKVPISLIRIGYDVHKIKQGVMPGEDKPYKVIKARITHRLEQLGFKMLMIPVGNTVKTVFAAGVSAAAHAHNAMVEKEEDKVKISSWAKVLGTEALLTGGSVPVSLGAKTAADLVMEPSPKLTTEEQQVVEQIKQALVGESASQEMDAVDESSPISNAYPDIDRGEGEYKEAVDKSLAKIARTHFGRDLIESMNKQGVEVTQPNEEERLRQEGGQTFYATYANPEQNTIFFDPWNTLAAESDEQANDKPWLRRDPSIALFHEMLHLYYHSHPVKVNYQSDWFKIDELGAKLAPEGASEEEKESLSHGIFEHFVAGADYDANDVHLAFSDPSFIEQSVQVGNGRYISENDYREAFYRAQGQAVIKRLDYGDSSFTGHDGDRYAPQSKTSNSENPISDFDELPDADKAEYEEYMNEVKTWQYELEGSGHIEITGTEEYFDNISEVLNDLNNTETGKKIFHGLNNGQTYFICPPTPEVGREGEYRNRVSTDISTNTIYFDPLTCVSIDSETDGAHLPTLMLAHELIHLIDYQNISLDINSDVMTQEQRDLLEHMAVGIKYIASDGTEIDFSIKDVKHEYLRDGAPAITVNQLREELGLPKRSAYISSEGNNSGHLFYQSNGQSNVHIALLEDNIRGLEQQLEWLEAKKRNTWKIRFIKRKALNKRILERRSRINRIRSQIADLRAQEAPTPVEVTPEPIGRPDLIDISNSPQLQAIVSVHEQLSQHLRSLSSSSLYAETADQLQLRILEELKGDSANVGQPLKLDYIDIGLPMKSLGEGWGIEVSVDTELIDHLLKVSFPGIAETINSSSPVIVTSDNGDGSQALSILNVGQLISAGRSSRLDTPWGRVPFQVFRVPPSIEPIQTVLKNVHDKISSEPQDRLNRIYTAKSRYQRLDQSLQQHYRLTPGDFDRRPTPQNVVNAMNNLKGAIAYLAYDYELFMVRPADLNSSREGYAGYVEMREMVNRLKGSLDSYLESETGTRYLEPKAAVVAKALSDGSLESTIGSEINSRLLEEATKISVQFPEILKPDSVIEITHVIHDEFLGELTSVVRMSVSDMLMKTIPTGEWRCVSNCIGGGEISNSDRDRIIPIVTQARYNIETEIPFQQHVDIMNSELEFVLDTLLKVHTQEFLNKNAVPHYQKQLLESFLSGQQKAYRCAYDGHIIHSSVFIPYDANNGQNQLGTMPNKDGLLYSPYSGFTWINSSNYSLSDVQQEAIRSGLAPQGKSVFDRSVSTKFIYDSTLNKRFPVDPLRNFDTQIGDMSFDPDTLSQYLTNSMSEYFDKVFDHQHDSLQEEWAKVHNNLKTAVALLSLIAIPVPQLSLALVAGNITVSIITLTDPSSSRSDKAWAIAEIGLEALGAIGDVITLSKGASRTLMTTLEQFGSDSAEFKRVLSQLTEAELVQQKGRGNKLFGIVHRPKKPAVPSPRFNPDPSVGTYTRVSQTAEESAAINEIKSQVVRLPKMEGYITTPAENCQNAAEIIHQHLRGVEGVENIKIGNIAIWDEFIGKPADMFDNHWVIFARYKGVDVVFDPTAGQFSKYGIQGPIFDTSNNWFAQYQNALGGYKNRKILAKIAYPDNFGSSAPYRSQEIRSAFDPVTSGDPKVLVQSRWYNEIGFDSNLKSQSKPLLKGGNDGFSWPKWKASKPESTNIKVFDTTNTDGDPIKANVVRKKVGEDFMLYTTDDGVQADALWVSVHGGYHASPSILSAAGKTGDMPVPEGVTIEFLGPHGMALEDPTIGLMNSRSLSPYSTVTSDGATHATGDLLDASGSNQVGHIKDYRMSKYQRSSGRGAETEDKIASALVKNRLFDGNRKTDVLTVRDRSLTLSTIGLSDMFEQLKLNNSQYKYVTFSGCRNELSVSNPVGYSVKGEQRMLITVDISGDVPRVVYARPITDLLQHVDGQGDSTDSRSSDD
ncbi:M91 family zinc metallopeptidase [Vibrio aquimaris]|uniref:Uncharacterized protein n=1 Tax=Vibrio aquimaris TaxID=2587862 RepID=A0A5P9CI66_9VIBR|nr:M91 family zinc metallopeptidase [Vibrio aquimaris]QFT25944.1 hypothetical protein FIV01_05850 [Vibrio aquimaris]